MSNFKNKILVISTIIGASQSYVFAHNSIENELSVMKTEIIKIESEIVEFAREIAAPLNEIGEILVAMGEASHNKNEVVAGKVLEAASLVADAPSLTAAIAGTAIAINIADSDAAPVVNETATVGTKIVDIIYAATTNSEETPAAVLASPSETPADVATTSTPSTPSTVPVVTLASNTDSTGTNNKCSCGIV